MLLCLGLMNEGRSFTTHAECGIARHFNVVVGTALWCHGFCTCCLPALWLLFSEGRCWECYCSIGHIYLLLCPSDCSFVIILSSMLYKLKFFAKDMVALLVTLTLCSS